METSLQARWKAPVSLSLVLVRTGEFAIDNFARAARRNFPDANALHMITAGADEGRFHGGGLDRAYARRWLAAAQ